jgi:23S rRNA (pseudouridine1915-N3)-methyltransferase
LKLSILAVGRLRGGPEKTLIDDYLQRFDAAGRPLALGPARVVEVEDKRRRGRDAEAELLLSHIPAGAAAIALDERGKTLSSPDFADLLARLRDEGRPETCLMIGGADGHGRAALARADVKLSLGKMVWPHMLARVMLAEQLYRAASILGGSPYHRA